jgi:hypothetical protein
MIETYSIIAGADESILKLNNVLEDYEFVKISLEELEKKFSNLFNLSRDIISEGSIQLDDGQILSREFHYIIVTGNPFIEVADICAGYQIMLRSKSNIPEVGNKELNSCYSTEVSDLMEKHQKGFELILKALRLTAAGHIGTSVTFQIEGPSHHIRQILMFNRRTQIPRLRFGIQNEGQMKDFKAVLQNLPPNKKNFQLAFSTFENSYDMPDHESDFIMCITVLESIFNHTKDQISHTIARHLSVVISPNINEFKSNYTRIKRLYNERSNLVHGRSDEISEENLIAANELARKALRFCLDKDFTRESLFEYCNSRGFSEMELRPIKTETDYQKALAEIEALFDAAPNTAECDRLDILATLVEAYEKKHYPIDLPDPIASIK